MTTKRIHLTDAVIKSLRKPNKGRDYYNDDREGGLQLQVTKNGYKTFYLCKFYCGKCKRFFIGKSDEITVSQARIRAAERKLNLSKGIGVKNETTSVVIPNEEMSFLSAFELYLRDRKDISPKTLKNYKSMWKKIEPRFGGMKLSMIDDNSIREFHSYLSLNTGKCQANRVLTLMKAIVNFLIRRGFYKKNNPAILVSPNKEKHRARVLTDEELPRFFNSVNELKNTTVRDAILLLLYTGARKSNVMEMRWNDIDLVGKIWSIPMTKSGKSLRLPLAEKAVEILEDRKKNICQQ